MTFEIGNMQLTGDGGWTAGDRQGDPRHAAGGRTARPSPTTSPSTSRAWCCRRRRPRRSAPTGVLPPEIGPVAVDATLGFDRPWDRPALESDNPVLRAGRRPRHLADLGQARPARPRRRSTSMREGFAEGRLEPPGAQLGGHDRRSPSVGGGAGPDARRRLRSGLGAPGAALGRPGRARGAARLRGRADAAGTDRDRAGAAAGAARVAGSGLGGRPAEVGGGGVLAGLDDAAADGAGAGEVGVQMRRRRRGGSRAAARRAPR